MKLSIITKRPISTPEGGFDTAAHEYIPGETVEQLASRLFYDCDQVSRETNFKYIQPRLAWGAHSCIVELRIEKEL